MMHFISPLQGLRNVGLEESCHLCKVGRHIRWDGSSAGLFVGAGQGALQTMPVGLVLHTWEAWGHLPAAFNPANMEEQFT